MKSEVLDRGLVLESVRVCEAAAIAAWKLVGLGDEIAHSSIRLTIRLVLSFHAV